MLEYKGLNQGWWNNCAEYFIFAGSNRFKKMLKQQKFGTVGLVISHNVFCDNDSWKIYSLILRNISLYNDQAEHYFFNSFLINNVYVLQPFIPSEETKLNMCAFTK